MDYTLRQATSEDLDALLALYGAYHEELLACGMNYDLNRETLPRVLNLRIKSRLILTGVAEDALGALAGFVFCSILRLSQEYLCAGSASVGYLNDLYVVPEARRNHLAGQLAAFAEDWLRQNGITAMELQVLGGNTGAQRFWQSQGLHPIGTLCYKPL